MKLLLIFALVLILAGLSALIILACKHIKNNVKAYIHNKDNKAFKEYLIKELPLDLIVIIFLLSIIILLCLNITI